MNTRKTGPALNRLTSKKQSSFVTHAMTVAVMVLLIMPVCGRATDFKDLLSGKACPLSMKLSDLNSEWRRITVCAAGSVSGNISVSVSGNQASSSSQNNVAELIGKRNYITRGQTVSANGQVYLVAYHLPGGGLDLQALIQAIATKTPPQTATLTPESTLPLSLLDVKSMGSLDDIRAFDIKREIAESERLVRTITAVLKSASAASTNNPIPTAKDKSNK
jgi:hypothetical protein